MNRYDIWSIDAPCTCCGPTLDESINNTDGKWVKFEEANKEISCVKAHIETLRELRKLDREKLKGLETKLAKVAELKRQWEEYNWHEDHEEIMGDVCVDLGNVLS